MGAPDGFEAMAEACIANHEAIVRHGSPELQTASRMLLYALAETIRQREEWPDAAVIGRDPEGRYGRLRVITGQDP